jgi:hypothetical protein
MRKQLTGEPVAGELHTGFGGRGWRQPFPTPIPRSLVDGRERPVYGRLYAVMIPSSRSRMISIMYMDAIASVARPLWPLVIQFA